MRFINFIKNKIFFVVLKKPDQKDLNNPSFVSWQIKNLSVNQTYTNK